MSPELFPDILNFLKAPETSTTSFLFMGLMDNKSDLQPELQSVVVFLISFATNNLWAAIYTLKMGSFEDEDLDHVITQWYFLCQEFQKSISPWEDDCLFSLYWSLFLYLSSDSVVSTGTAGPCGPPGPKGIQGLPGPCVDNPEKDSFLFTRHSQNLFVPRCPPGTNKVYSGYSLLFINGNNRAHGQDLGNMTPLVKSN